MYTNKKIIAEKKAISQLDLHFHIHHMEKIAVKNHPFSPDFIHNNTYRYALIKAVRNPYPHPYLALVQSACIVKNNFVSKLRQCQMLGYG